MSPRSDIILRFTALTYNPNMDYRLLRIFYSFYNEKITLYKKGNIMFTQTLIAIVGIAFFAVSSVLYYARMFS
jgi:hypothetical protein|nr:MAG TPA: hypothetical protein [Caudoviricetes sp.]